MQGAALLLQLWFGPSRKDWRKEGKMENEGEGGK